MNERSLSEGGGYPLDLPELPAKTTRCIAKLLSVRDSLARHEEMAPRVELLDRVIDALHRHPLPVVEAWDSPEEPWLREAIEAGVVPAKDYFYVLDLLTNEARDDAAEAWHRHLLQAMDAQEREVPLPAQYEADPNGPSPYDRLRAALRVLPDNPREMMGDVWLYRAVRLGLLPRERRGRYLDIFLNVREKARFLRETEDERRWAAIRASRERPFDE